MKSISTEEFDRRFDDGEDMDEYLDIDNPVVTVGCIPKDSSRKTTMNMPTWVLEEADLLAAHMAISRNAVINMWACEMAEKARDKRLSA